MTKIRVMFVCLGNICRSPIGEGSFRAQVERAGLSEYFQIHSGGTIGYHAGDPPDRRSVEVARSHGVDISKQRSSKVSGGSLGDYDEILAMDSDNLRELKRLLKHAGAEARLGLLLDELDGPRGLEVPDPYYGGPQGFEEVWGMVDRACAALLGRLIDAHDLPKRGRR